MDPKPATLDPAMVRDFVIAGHGNLDRLKELLAAEPGLLNAAWDWGGGDWETALGGAAHMGRRDIAAYLLDCGARIDVFAAAMLGQLAIVRAIVETLGLAASQPGPHGIPLLAHALAGGPEAAAVAEFLQTA
jgi:hypothetical protein